MKGCLANQADLDTEWNLFIGKKYATGPGPTWDLKAIMILDVCAGSEAGMIYRAGNSFSAI